MAGESAYGSVRATWRAVGMSRPDGGYSRMDSICGGGAAVCKQASTKALCC
jgi:hypothetical protein